jgi:hypothetical protein
VGQPQGEAVLARSAAAEFVYYGGDDAAAGTDRGDDDESGGWGRLWRLQVRGGLCCLNEAPCPPFTSHGASITLMRGQVDRSPDPGGGGGCADSRAMGQPQRYVMPALAPEEGGVTPLEVTLLQDGAAGGAAHTKSSYSWRLCQCHQPASAVAPKQRTAYERRWGKPRPPKHPGAAAAAMLGGSELPVRLRTEMCARTHAQTLSYALIRCMSFAYLHR